ncbi:MAG: NAD-dependent epimerase/dehydratase family protein [Chloroflexi bacterium]|nr:NAD-dependent epimerase/dehydratase family protein [Chloroflexota bacterium]
MKALVTGATGFIGGNVVRQLQKQGYQVRAFVRKNSVRQNIEGLNVEVAVGDLRDRISLDEALRGCDVLFHVAASYTFWTPDPAAIYETNVKGTENILSVALRRGISKVVYTSSESTIPVRNGCLGTEEADGEHCKLPGHYKKSKYLAEKLALKMCQEGLPLVVVNPTTPIGPFDVKPTPTGKFVVDFLNRRVPVYVNTGLNIVDVEDVAKGHILALEKGRTGERYILGNQNLAFREILGILERLTGIAAPKVRIPIWVVLSAAYTDEFVNSTVLRRCPGIPVAGVKAARKFRHFDCSKAVRELGLPQTPVEEAFQKAIQWFKENGYVKQQGPEVKQPNLRREH